MAKIIKKQAKKKRIKTILTIHDVNSIRTASSITRLYYQMLVREIDFMDSFDCIICHTPAMKRYLIKEGIDEKKVVVLEIFDYLVEGGEKRQMLVQTESNLSILRAIYPETRRDTFTDCRN